MISIKERFLFYIFYFMKFLFYENFYSIKSYCLNQILNYKSKINLLFFFYKTWREIHQMDLYQPTIMFCDNV